MERELRNLPAGSEVVFTSAGVFEQSDIERMCTHVENELLSREVAKSSVKRTFTILIEALQNAFLHGVLVDGEHLMGLLVAVSDTVHLSVLSITDEETLTKVKRLTADLNAMDPKELKAHYLTTMTNGKISEKGGAGLGLITMVSKSRSGMELSSAHIDNQTVVISRMTA